MGKGKYMQIDQKGFAHLGMVLLLGVVLVLGGAGWYVYNQNKVSDPEPSIVAESTTQNKQDDSKVDTTNEDEDSNKGYLVLAQWGVRLPIDPLSKSLSYTLSNDGVTARIRSAELDEISGVCQTNSINVVRGRASDLVPVSTEPWTGTFLQLYNLVDKSTLGTNSRAYAVQEGDYYYIAPGYSAASCASSSEDESTIKDIAAAENQAELRIVNSINKLEPAE